ncbi:ParA family protein [Tranquillimonas alkanivorans]|uniref:Chromosome partitioning protein n=1 Tax=Tranquillimonas alkanivorans TaxID=441119 RepID=A0A1I5W0D0_9RHOB|nr:ParA family protein [Tranquillimonas alkanivorans]SFQ13189.1 chromosome partitioning protein [Tranquillimonas alkanivorans]
MTRIITVASHKGGTGKTCLSVTLAVEAARANGARVALLDLDPQRSACAWAELRSEAAPLVVPCRDGDLEHYLSEARVAGFDTVFIDTPSGGGKATDRAIASSDLVVIPVRPAFLDLEALQPTVTSLRSHGTRGLFVLAQVPARGQEEDAARRDLAARFPRIPVASVRLGHRKDFERALGLGLSATETRSKRSIAAAEGRLLWEAIRATCAGSAQARRSVSGVS